MERNLVVGAGFSGAVIARLIAENFDEKTLIIDKREHLGGNSYDYTDENGIKIHKYGSHIFHTNSEKVWNFFKRFTKINTYMHRVKAVVDGIEIPVPFNLNSLHLVFPETLALRLEEKLLSIFEYNTKVPILELKKQEDEDLKFLADYIYEKVFLGYTIKQWGVRPEEIDESVTARVPVYISKDDRYFQDKYQGIPTLGYTRTIEKILKHPNIEVKLNTDYKNVSEGFKRIFYTGSIDEFFGYKFGILPYRSVYFDMETHNKKYFQSRAQINYPCNYDFTRIHEYKYYLSDNTTETVIAKEYSEPFEIEQNDRYYPIQSEENTMLYNKYYQEAETLDNVYFLGRLGDYKYYNMDQAILRAIELFERIEK